MPLFSYVGVGGFQRLFFCTQLRRDNATKLTVLTGKGGYMPEIDNNESIEQNESENAPRMFTQEEVDAIVKRRIDKQAARHNEKIAEIMAQLDEANGLAAAATKERDEMRHANEIRQWASEAAKEFGVPESLLRGESLDELKAHAQEIAKLMGDKPYPNFRDSGEGKSSAPSEKSEFIKQIFSN